MGPLGGVIVGDTWAGDVNGLYWLAVMALAGLVAILAAGSRRTRAAEAPPAGPPAPPQPPPLPPVRRVRPVRPTGGFPVIQPAPAAAPPVPAMPAVRFVPVPVVPAQAVRPGEDGPGRYRVVGVVRATGADVALHVEALSLANAKVKAELKGVIVTAVEKCELAREAGREAGEGEEGTA